MSALKIGKIEWRNHPILGNLQLNLMKSEREVFSTIVLAGENGTGKTTILRCISDIMTYKNMEYVARVEYMIGEKRYSLLSHTENDIGFWGLERKGLDDRYFKSINAAALDEIDTEDDVDLRNHGYAISNARTGFLTHEIEKSTDLMLDQQSYEDDNEEDFTKIKQLLIDLEAQDSFSLMQLHRNGEFDNFEEFRAHSRMFRFENAFNNFFDNMTFKYVDNQAKQDKQVYFEKYNKSIPIDQLSTGEKQIVFRGASLLKNNQRLEQGIVLVDEPELSMHPKWQLKILNFYKDLFKNGDNQTVQIFSATHSESVLKVALEDRDNTLVVILKSNESGIEAVPVISPMVFPSITSAETNYFAYDIITTDYHIELYSHIQSLSGTTTIKACDNFIKQQTQYDAFIHRKPYTFGNVTYETLPTYIRNCIDHPGTGYSYSDEELKKSIELMIEICR